MADPNYPSNDFEAQSADLLRRRTLASLLQKQGMEGVQTPNKGVMHWTQTLGPAMAAALGGFQANQVSSQEQELAKQREAQAREWMANMPKGTPGVSAAESNVPQPGQMGPPMQGEGVPMLPKAPKAADILPWAAQGTQLGGQAGKFAEAASVAAQKRMLDPYEKIGNDIYNPETGEMISGPTTVAANKARQEAAAAEHERKVAADKAEEARKTQEGQWRHEDRQTAMQLHKAIAGASQGGTFTALGTDESGAPVVLNNRSGQAFVSSPDGLKPHAGQVFKSGDTKAINDAMGAENEARMAEEYATKVEKNKDAFGVQQGLGTKLPGQAGVVASGLNPQQMELRGQVYRDFAETTKRLYGASFTANEQARAETFTPGQYDSPERVAAKLRSAAVFNREMATKYGKNINAAAQARLGGEGGGAPPAGAPNTGLRSKYGL